MAATNYERMARNEVNDIIIELHKRTLKLYGIRQDYWGCKNLVIFDTGTNNQVMKFRGGRWEDVWMSAHDALEAIRTFIELTDGDSHD